MDPSTPLNTGVPTAFFAFLWKATIYLPFSTMRSSALELRL